MANRLAHETSPYLQQHKDNPVDWYPWGPEALERAKREDKPILLSVGYSACHWCHVMAHESFENVDTAKLMNELFINIKVDREERPDLDQIYQNVAQALTMSGGWPLTVFLTPNLQPFFGGTYYPPEDRYGRPGFPRVLKALSDAYHNKKQDVLDNAQKLTEHIRDSSKLSPQVGTRAPTRDGLAKAAANLIDRVDFVYGGLGGAPKFPNTMALTFLWRYGIASDEAQSKEAALLSLEKMCEGGIYDQLGGGFHRYSVDETWSVPHFEKMLYDNALLLRLLSEVILSADRAILPHQRVTFLRVLRETVAYVGREMTSPDGMFYAAQDADTEGEEGKFFVWDESDFDRLLEGEEARLLKAYYGVTSQGNFEHGKTVLHVAKTLKEVAERLGYSKIDVQQLWESGRAKLFEDRRKRITPGLDSKILTAWNGLMISGLAWSTQAFSASGHPLDAERTLMLARRAFEAIEGAASAKDPLFSTLHAGKGKLRAYLDDYAFMARAALDLARVTPDEQGVKRLTEQAQSWIGQILTHFSDPSQPGYFFTSNDHEQLLDRPKSFHDQAIPSGTAVTLECLMALTEIVSPEQAAEYEHEVSRQLLTFVPLMERHPFGYGEYLCGALLRVLGPVTVTGAGASDLCKHPHVYRKPQNVMNGEGPGLMVCHSKVCSMPLASQEDAWSSVRLKLGWEPPTGTSVAP